MTTKKIYFLLSVTLFAQVLFGTNTEIEVNWEKDLPMCYHKKSAAVATIIPLRNGLWFEADVWPNGQRPTLNDDVVIPAGMDIVMAGTIRARKIEVSGVLRAVNWQPDGAWIELQTKAIHVLNGGVFEIGTEQQHYQADCIITLVGSNPSEELCPAMGSKFIGAMPGGTIRMHGAPTTSWVKIGSPAAAGNNTLNLSKVVNWKVGDKIVISSNRYNHEEVEEKTITAVSTNGQQITLDSPLTYPRLGKIETYSRNTDGRSWQVDMRAEVGLLSKNITIQGDESSVSNGFGGHIMSMNNSVMNASNIELFRMGQKSKIGRYPWHWHLLGDLGNGQYLKNSSVHKSFNRAIVIHGTWGALVDNNVAYDHIGHGIMLEDGSEINNTISNNLALITRRPATKEEAITPSDFEPFDDLQSAAPSTYWITNPNNSFINNVAAGSIGTAFWFAFPTSPTGASANDPRFSGMQPHTEQLGVFDGNTSHSNRSGLDINDRLDANHALIGNGAWSVSNQQTLRNHTAFANRVGFYSGIGRADFEQIKLENFRYAENEIHLMLATRNTFENSIFIARTNADLLNGGSTMFYNSYDGAGRIYNCHFIDWDKSGNTFTRTNGAAEKRSDHIFQGITSNHTTSLNIPFVPGSFRAPLNTIEGGCGQTFGDFIYDRDGSLTGKAQHTIAPNADLYRTGAETDIPTWETMILSPHKYVHTVSFNNVPTLVYRKNRDGQVKGLLFSQCNLGPLSQFHLMVNRTYIPEQEHHFLFSSLPTSNSFDFRVQSEVVAGESLIVRFKGIGRLQNVVVSTANRLNSIQEVQNSSGSAYYAEPNGDLYFKAVTTNNFNGKSYNISWTGNASDLNFSYDSDGDGLSDLDEVTNGSDPLSADAVSLDFNNTDENFTPINISNVSIGMEAACFEATNANDPFIRRDNLNLLGSSIDKLLVRVKSAFAGDFRFYYATQANNGFSEARAISAQYTKANEWQTLVFDLSGQTQWNQNIITQLRLDFPGNNNSVVQHCVDYIKTISNDPNRDSDGDGTTDQEEIAICRDAYSPTDLNLDFNNTNDGFTNFNRIASTENRTNHLVINTDGTNDPFMFRNGFSFDGSVVNKIKVRLKCTQTGDFQLFWGRENAGNFSGSRVVSKNYPVANEWRELVFDFDGNPEWIGQTITDLRLDFPAGLSTVTVDWIRGEDYVPGVTLQPYLRADNNPLQPGNEITVCEGSSVLLDFLGAFGEGWSFRYSRENGSFSQVNFGLTQGVDRDQLLLDSDDFRDGGIDEGTWTVAYTDPNGCTGSTIITVNIENCDDTSIILYSECNYRGQSFPLAVGEYPDIAALGFPDNSLSSIAIPVGYTVTLYTEPNFGGGFITLGRDYSCFLFNGFNDVVSSIKITSLPERVTTPMGTSTIVNPFLSSFKEWSNSIELFPNPANTILNINTSNLKGQVLHYNIYSIDGKQVARGHFEIAGTNSASLEIPLNTIRDGMYMLQLQTKRQQVLKRFIVKKN